MSSKVKKNNMAPIEPEDLERTDMVDLVKEFLTGPDDKLKIFGEKTLSEALEDCVDKSRTGAIQETADEQLEKKQRQLFSNQVSSKVADIDESLNDIAPADNSALDESSMMVEDTPRAKPSKRKAPQNHRPKAAATSFEASSDEEIEVVEKPKPKPRTKRTAAKRKVAYSVEDDDDLGSDDDFGDVNTNTKAKVAPRSRAKAKKSTVKRPRRRFDSDDDEEEEDYSEIAANWGSAATQSQF